MAGECGEVEGEQKRKIASEKEWEFSICLGYTEYLKKKSKLQSFRRQVTINDIPMRNIWEFYLCPQQKLWFRNCK